MKKSVVLVLLVLITLPAISQHVAPGGVRNLYLWNTVSNTGSFATLKTAVNDLPDSFPSFSGRRYNMNNNPAVYYSGKSVESSLDLSQLSGYTLFTICQPTDTTKEQVIFCTEGDTSTETVLTDRRLASLYQYKYANYGNRAKNYPRIYSYCHHAGKDTTLILRKLRLGQTPHKQNLPVQAFSGIIPEIILYDRNLLYRERLRVESYLALKYGIPIGQQYPVPYLSSRGDTIWNADTNAKYASNIAGIGRDDASGLKQAVSECVQSPGLMKISCNSTMADNSFIIWGDNGATTSFGEHHNLPKCLGRDWRLNAYNTTGTKINLYTSPLAIEEINPLNEGETYWLMMDLSGTGSYPFGKAAYIKCRDMAILQDTIKFNNVTADSDSSGADVFTLLAMPELFTRCLLKNPKCDKSGTLQVEIVGGTAPYQLILNGQNTSNNSQSLTTTSNTIEINGITQGSYTLKVTDAHNQAYINELWVSNSYTWECNIKQKYQITEGASITLDASEKMPTGYTYSWTAPSGEITNTSILAISQVGDYYLTITNTEGCNSIMKINVAQYKAAEIDAVVVSPNPTKGNFVVRAELADKSALTIILADVNGEIINTSTLKGDSYYWYNGTLPKPGLYLLTLKTPNDKKTFKLIGY